MSVYDINRILVPDVPPDYEDHTGLAHYVPAPCQVACPIGTDAPSYLAYIWEGKIAEAFEAITATNPFSSICGRVCDAPCEPACRRVDSDGAVQIKNLKRYVMDILGASYEPPGAPVTRPESVGIVGAGPAGLVAAHDLCVAGFEVHVYEMTDRLGGLIIWGIPEFRLPPGIINEDIDRLMKRCPALKVHLNCALGREIDLAELKSRHEAVLLTIGSWWGKPMGIPGEDHGQVIDGVGFLRRINDGERPELPETVVVVGGGDVAMDACRVAKRLPGCKHVKVIYRRGPEEIPARAIELHHAIREKVEFVYHTQQVAVEARGNRLALRCVRTELGDPDEDGRRRPVEVPGSEHEIECGMVIAAVGQRGESEELDRLGMMLTDRVCTDWNTMGTDDPKVFAAGDGAFGGSTIVMAMHHGQRAAYYVRSYLDGHESPMPYRTPFRTRRVPVAQDLLWEMLPVEEPRFFGLGDNPVEFPEIEATYDEDAARREAARCYRCDAETGSADYSVQHREDIFSMARTNALDHAKHRAMLDRRMRLRENPFPHERPASMDDLVFLPANLSRLVIDPYREACKISTEFAGKLDLVQPFLVAGFDHAPAEVRSALARGLGESGCAYVGHRSIGGGVPWIQIFSDTTGGDPTRGLSDEAAGIAYAVGSRFVEPSRAGTSDAQAVGLVLSALPTLEDAIAFALEHEYDFLLLDGSGDLGGDGGGWPELAKAPNLRLMKETIAILRRLKREEWIDIAYFGGARSGTDAAKLIGLGANAIVYAVAVALAMGGVISPGHDIQFSPDLSEAERAQAAANILKANAGEASMMARCTGKTNLHNLEPEDLRTTTVAAAKATGIPLAGTRASMDIGAQLG